MNELNNKVAIVTGANRGIGAAIAQELASAGASVVINYPEVRYEAEAVRLDIERAGGRAIAVRADISIHSEVEAMFGRVETDLGRVDILVNNAAVETRKPALEYSEADFDRILDTNLRGAFWCAQRALPSMKTQAWGRIINISSIHQFKPNGFCAPYSMSKGGLLMMTRELALEFGPFGITVNNIAPGAILTDMNREILSDPDYNARVVAKTPARRIGEPHDIARAVVFLAAPGSRFITGTTLFVDGGLSL